MRVLLAAALALLLAACAQPKPASRDTIVLLPEANGRKTAVIVDNGGGKVTLDHPYAAARTGEPGTAKPFEANAGEVQSTFGAALAAQPARPRSFQLYFIEGSDTFTDETKRTVDAVFGEIARRPSPEIGVVGHTDRVGSDQSNDALSLRRAEFVRGELIKRGVAPDNIQASGRGEREPIVPTADGVAEPRNRRVEIIVR